MTSLSREFQIFAKPVGARCNLSCNYCYYLGKRDLYPDSGPVRMKEDLLEKYIIQQIDASTGSQITFSWHGGEPTLAGLDFYRKAVELQKKHKPFDCEIINGLQTNATLLNDEWCGFLASEKFFVGVSIDGTEEMHNQFRVSENGKGSFQQTVNGYMLLKKHSVQTELLAVVNSFNVNRPIEIYRFLKQLGTEYITFLPLVEREANSVSSVSNNSVPAEAFGVFLSTIFDEWLANDIGKIKVQVFEEALRTAFQQDHTLCIFKRTCGGVPVLEHNGDFYSCDHYVDKEHNIGNIEKSSISEMLDCEKQKEFGEAKLKYLPQYCIVCEVRDMCNGECPKNRFIKAPSGEQGLNYLCPGYKIFFNHIKPFVDSVSMEWKKKN